MEDANEKLVKKALRACSEGDEATLKSTFAYDYEVRIKGAIPCSDPYPLRDDEGLSYGRVEARGNTVRSEIKYKRDEQDYSGTLIDEIEDTGSGRKISSSTVLWDKETSPYSGKTYDEADGHEGTYGWWAWPFGRRRYR